MLKTKLEHDLEDLNDISSTRLDMTSQDKKELKLTQEYLKKLLEINLERQGKSTKAKRGWWSWGLDWSTLRFNKYIVLHD